MEALYFVLALAILFFTWRKAIRPRLLKTIPGKAVVVTGCDYGFGKIIAKKLFKEGAIVYAGCLFQSSIDALNKEFNDPKMRPILLDVTKDDHVAAAVDTVTKSGVCLQAIVNNAGITAFGYTELLTLSRYQKNMEVNYFGTVRMTRGFLPLLRKYRGRIVNIGSIGARMPSAFGSAYLSTKAAMCSYSECVRQEVHRFGVKVCLVEPGFYETELLANGSKNGGSDIPDDATEDVLNAYGNFASKMNKTAEPIRLVEKLNGGKEGLNYVADQVYDAIANRFPLARYVLGYDANLIRFLLVYIPCDIIDWVQTLQK